MATPSLNRTRYNQDTRACQKLHTFTWKTSFVDRLAHRPERPGNQVMAAQVYPCGPLRAVKLINCPCKVKRHQWTAMSFQVLSYVLCNDANNVFIKQITFFLTIKLGFTFTAQFGFFPVEVSRKKWELETVRRNVMFSLCKETK